MNKPELEYLKAIIYAEMKLAEAFKKHDVVKFCEQFHSMINHLIDKISDTNNVEINSRNTNIEYIQQ